MTIRDLIRNVTTSVAEISVLRDHALRSIAQSGLVVVPSPNVPDGKPLIMVSMSDYQRMCEIVPPRREAVEQAEAG